MWTAHKAAAQNPEIKRLGKLELFVYVSGGGRSLQVHFLQEPEAPHLSYAEVTVRAFDAGHSEIKIGQSLPGEKNCLGPPYRSSQHTGFYVLAPQKDQRLTSVEVSGAAKSRYSRSPRR